MAIEFRCSQCGRLLRTGDETAGRMAQCPECGSQTPIPFPGREELITPVEVGDVEAGDSGLPRMEPVGDSPFRATPHPSRAGIGNAESDPYRVQAVTALVLGITGVALSIFCCICAPVGLIVSSIGLAFGVIGLRSTTRNTLAVAGIVLSILGIVISIPFLLASGILPRKIGFP
jgi:hypothetical protein